MVKKNPKKSLITEITRTVNILGKNLFKSDNGILSYKEDPFHSEMEEYFFKPMLKINDHNGETFHNWNVNIKTFDNIKKIQYLTKTYKFRIKAKMMNLL